MPTASTARSEATACGRLRGSSEKTTTAAAPVARAATSRGPSTSWLRARGTAAEQCAAATPTTPPRRSAHRADHRPTAPARSLAAWVPDRFARAARPALLRWPSGSVAHSWFPLPEIGSVPAPRGLAPDRRSRPRTAAVLPRPATSRWRPDQDRPTLAGWSQLAALQRFRQPHCGPPPLDTRPLPWRRPDRTIAAASKRARHRHDSVEEPRDPMMPVAADS